MKDNQDVRVNTKTVGLMIEAELDIDYVDDDETLKNQDWQDEQMYQALETIERYTNLNDVKLFSVED